MAMQSTENSMSHTSDQSSQSHQKEKDILLCTLNARYLHASLGIRYLYANMSDLQKRTQFLEFTIHQRAEDIAEQLLLPHIRIIGFGVYIWNVTETMNLLRLIRVLRPDIHLVIGGPEVSHDLANQHICSLADTVITGAADKSFAMHCQQVLSGEPWQSVVSSLPQNLDGLKSPYPYYNAEDLANRIIYVEASRGCPFKCEFCLSSLDKTAVAFNTSSFLEHMHALIKRGARHFKFVDRTFNLKIDTSRQILEFFLTHIDRGLFLHFELIPDRLPDVLKELLPRFPKGSLQFEIGIQSFNPEVQRLISRRQNHQKTCDNLRWLRTQTSAHIHADLIFGLPGETLQSFADGFDELMALGPQEIQVGLLKRLRGTPIDRHTSEFNMRYMATPPYQILANRDIDFNTMQRMVRFARYWDLVGNSGRFPQTLPLLLGQSPFQQFMSFSDWLFETTEQTHKFALSRLFSKLDEYLRSTGHHAENERQNAIDADYRHNNLRRQSSIKAKNTCESRKSTSIELSADATTKQMNKRQRRHTHTIASD
ncbi:MAG: DUF4080 domain-containing protein [Granulosicoccus sp.]|nr:DUF4080 domain-containing protein [Granulosicoccus sp.]